MRLTNVECLGPSLPAPCVSSTLVRHFPGLLNRPPKVTILSLLLLTDCPSKYTSFLCQSCPQPKKWRRLLCHMSRLHCIPRDVVSDWGLHFVSQFWKEFCSFLGASITFSPTANQRVPCPLLLSRPRVWLSTKDLPLRVESCKLAPCSNGPVPASKVVYPVAVRLKLPRSMRAHPNFHVACVKLVLMCAPPWY